MVPLDFLKYDVTWVASKISGAAGALGAEAIDLSNCLPLFGCASEDFRVVVVNMADWMDNSSPPWAAYRALTACHLVALDNHLGVCPIGIGETLRHVISKIVKRAMGDQEKTACGSLQLCAVIETGIEGGTHAMAQMRRERNAPAP